MVHAKHPWSGLCLPSYVTQHLMLRIYLLGKLSFLMFTEWQDILLTFQNTPAYRSRGGVQLKELRSSTQAPRLYLCHRLKTALIAIFSLSKGNVVLREGGGKEF